MTDPLIIAAPLLVGAVVMAVRFVGCSFSGHALTHVDYSGTVLGTANLVSFWELSEQSGSLAADSEDGNNGTYQGGVALHVPGLVSPSSLDSDNFGARFDGQTGYVSVPFTADLNPPKFTVEVLVQPSVIDPNRHVIVASDTGYQLVLHGNTFEAAIAAGGGFQSPVVVNAGAQPNQAYYVAMTYDGTNLQLYVNPAASDGEQNFKSHENPNNERYNSAQFSYQQATNNELRIGASSDGGSPGEFFAGVIQDVAVYSRALSFDEIVNHFWIFETGYSTPLGPLGDFSGSGTLAVTAAFPPNPPSSTEYPLAGTYTFAIPYWCIYIDLILLGGGGSGSNSLGIIPGTGGQGGLWATITVQRGVEIPWTTTSIEITVGPGGAAGSNGGNTTASATGMATQTGLGGVEGAGTNGITGASPGNVSYNGQTYTGGAGQNNAGAAGNAPGGGGAGGGSFGAGGPGAHGVAFVVARQT